MVAQPTREGTRETIIAEVQLAESREPTEPLGDGSRDVVPREVKRFELGDVAEHLRKRRQAIAAEANLGHLGGEGGVVRGGCLHPRQSIFGEEQRREFGKGEQRERHVALQRVAVETNLAKPRRRNLWDRPGQLVVRQVQHRQPRDGEHGRRDRADEPEPGEGQFRETGELLESARGRERRATSAAAEAAADFQRLELDARFDGLRERPAKGVAAEIDELGVRVAHRRREFPFEIVIREDHLDQSALPEPIAEAGRQAICGRVQDFQIVRHRARERAGQGVPRQVENLEGGALAQIRKRARERVPLQAYAFERTGQLGDAALERVIRQVDYLEIPVVFQDRYRPVESIFSQSNLLDVAVRLEEIFREGPLEFVPRRVENLEKRQRREGCGNRTRDRVRFRIRQHLLAVPEPQLPEVGGDADVRRDLAGQSAVERDERLKRSHAVVLVEPRRGDRPEKFVVGHEKVFEVRHAPPRVRELSVQLVAGQV